MVFTTLCPPLSGTLNGLQPYLIGLIVKTTSKTLTQMRQPLRHTFCALEYDFLLVVHEGVMTDSGDFENDMYLTLLSVTQL
jgi:hypothetical protein